MNSQDLLDNYFTKLASSKLDLDNDDRFDNGDDDENYYQRNRKCFTCDWRHLDDNDTSLLELHDWLGALASHIKNNKLAHEITAEDKDTLETICKEYLPT